MTTFMPPPPAATFLAFHPQDNNIIAIGMEDSTIQIYNVRVDEVKSKLKGHQKRITGLAFSNSLNVLVSSGADAQVHAKVIRPPLGVSIELFLTQTLICSYVCGEPTAGRNEKRSSYKFNPVEDHLPWATLASSFTMTKFAFLWFMSHNWLSTMLRSSIACARSIITPSYLIISNTYVLTRALSHNFSVWSHAVGSSISVHSGNFKRDLLL